MKTTEEIQGEINDVYKVAILDLLADGPQTNNVVIQHLLGGMTHGEMLFREVLAFVPAMAELSGEDKIVVYTLDGSNEPILARPETIDLSLVTPLSPPKTKGRIVDPSKWKDVTSTERPRVYLLDKSEADAIMARIMGDDDADTDGDTDE